ncbi:DNA replication complex GINS protein PSF1 [Galendromus occidentalis]|uniref:DNA replication complex GINS protein PSF1 n=1 Tax=Galendromus occidentalis TaxID=34638 RepID=A0AAJ6QNX2_9ACAR|nr:DNA replication complex GINS protein PSF1 [Galendromus occidentalis]
MTSLADQGLSLVKEILRCPDYLQPMREDALRNIFEEMRALNEANQKDVRLISAADSERSDGAPDVHVVLYVRHQLLLRLRRCIMAYLDGRLKVIREFRWAFGPVLTKDLKANMTDGEQKWFIDYSASLGRYMSSIGETGVDLLQHSKPPKSLYVEVRVLEDYGDFETEDGQVVVLAKNSTHFLERSQCEKLIRQGVLEHVVT